MPDNPDLDPQLTPLIDGAPRGCSRCGGMLCLRKQVINLSLGHDQSMFCLACLANDNNQSQTELLEAVKPYILNRDCFSKQWRRYEEVGFCPDRLNCFPDKCFEV